MYMAWIGTIRRGMVRRALNLEVLVLLSCLGPLPWHSLSATGFVVLLLL